MTPLWIERQPLSVEEDEHGQPMYFYWAGHFQKVEQSTRHWRVHLDWWTDAEIWRDYWEIVTDSGLLCVIYHDLINGDWVLERIYP